MEILFNNTNNNICSNKEYEKKNNEGKKIYYLPINKSKRSGKESPAELKKSKY